MSLFPTIFSSSDPGAPTLNGQAGSLVAVLDAILVNGYGSGPTAKAPLGWSTVYTASNKRAYRGNLSSATGYLLRVDDSLGRHALLRGFSSMSDIDTGTDVIPPVANRPDGEYWPKSTTADAASRKWWAIGNERCVYLIMEVMIKADGHADSPPFFFGDFISNRPGDAHAFAISHTLLTSYAGANTNLSNLWRESIVNSSSPTHLNGTACIGRAISGDAGSVYMQISPLVGEQTSAVGGGSIPYPIYAGGPMIYERVRCFEPGGIPRGHFPGVYGHMHNRPFDELTTVAGMLNKKFRAGSASVNNGIGQVFFQTDVEWV